MSYMFHYAIAYNQNLSLWNVKSVTNMSHMFVQSNLSLWNVELVADKSYMFSNATTFNQKICWTNKTADTWDMFDGSNGTFCL
jgi:surface protein